MSSKLRMSSRLSCGIVVAWLASFILPAAAAARIRYLAFGDSITVGYPRHDEDCPCEDLSECQQLCGYPHRLQNLLNAAGVDAGVLNRGLGGEKTPEGLTRLDEVLAEGGHVLLLMEGTNDISRNISPETTLYNLAEMGRKAMLRGFETVHVTLIPRIPEATVDRENVVSADIAQRIRDLAFWTDRQLVDPFEVFSTTPDLFEDFYADLSGDPVGHPNARGFDLLAEIFFNVLTNVDTVPPVVGSVTPANGAVDLGPLAPVQVRIYDFGVGLDLSHSILMINDEVVEFSASGGTHSQDLIFQPQSPHPLEVAVRVRSRDHRFNTMNREVSRFTVEDDPPGPCVPDETTLCIDRAVGDQRFRITLHWHTAQDGGQEGDAQAIPLAPIGLRRGGLFSFFDPDNPEILVKVLDGCGINNKFWVFVAPTTNLGYELKIVDTAAALQGRSRSEFEFIVVNPDGLDAPPLSETAAFSTCEFESP